MLSLMMLAAFVTLVWGAFLYNRLVKDRNRVRSAWSDIDVQLTRRYELVPRLVAAVKAYAGHERATLETVIELRNQSGAMQQLSQRSGLEDQLEVGVHKLIALAERYPDLKASENFIELQNDLVDIEDHLQYARRYYNGSVNALNTRIETIPDIVVARSFGFVAAEFFQAGSRAAPDVNF
jgi:LemA protein